MLLHFTDATDAYVLLLMLSFLQVQWVHIFGDLSKRISQLEYYAHRKEQRYAREKQ
jgi:hypothetical protein